MEFEFEVQKLLPGKITLVVSDSQNSSLKIYDLNSKTDQSRSDPSSRPNQNWVYSKSSVLPWDKTKLRRNEQLETVIDDMGKASAKAQCLRLPVTSIRKLLNSGEQKLYTIRNGENPRALIGILKMGRKTLYVNDTKGKHHEVNSLCVLDFYVHETKQRQGFGHLLFDAMLKAEDCTPVKLAIDRPSTKFLSFLRKHYELTGAIRQSNNFVIFPGFFEVKSDFKRNDRNGKTAEQYPQFSDVTDNKDTESAKLHDTPSFHHHRSESTLGCLQWNLESPVDNKAFEIDDAPNNNNEEESAVVISGENPTTFGKRVSEDLGWSVFDCMHSYKKEVNEQIGDLASPLASMCSINSDGAVLKRSKNRWDRTDSSWNVLGVKPKDYSKFQSKSFVDLESGAKKPFIC